MSSNQYEATERVDLSKDDLVGEVSLIDRIIFGETFDTHDCVRVSHHPHATISKLVDNDVNPDDVPETTVLVVDEDDVWDRDTVANRERHRTDVR